MRVNGWNLTGGYTGSGAARPSSTDAAAGVRDGAGPDSGSALSVSQAVDMAAGALDAIPQITVLGEVTGFRGPNARSGHCYFQIKDDSSAMECIIWKGAYAKRAFELRDGMQVQFTGQFNLYKPIGKMSFVARSFTPAGEGLLRQQVAALAEKLRREGLMDDSRKRRIPAFCSRVAVVTSLSGAVIDDVKRTLRRRNPLVELICVGSKVQGEGAPAELIDGLRRAAAIEPAPDCILLVRGGGSFEDLMTFNDESLARAVASCSVPVVTGIGHEPDNSICDMVGDRRCSTPTAAAESVAPSMGELADVLETRSHRLCRALDSIVLAGNAAVDGAAQRADRAMRANLSRLRMALDAAASRPCLTRPDAVLEQRAAELGMTQDRLAAAGVASQRRMEGSLDALAARLASSTSGMAPRRHELALAGSRLRHAGAAAVDRVGSELAAAAGKLDALSPLKVLSRGYSIAYADDVVATSAGAFAPGDTVRVRMADGSVYGTVTQVSPTSNRTEN